MTVLHADRDRAMREGAAGRSRDGGSSVRVSGVGEGSNRPSGAGFLGGRAMPPPLCGGAIEGHGHGHARWTVGSGSLRVPSLDASHRCALACLPDSPAATATAAVRIRYCLTKTVRPDAQRRGIVDDPLGALPEEVLDDEEDEAARIKAAILDAAEQIVLEAARNTHARGAEEGSAPVAAAATSSGAESSPDAPPQLQMAVPGDLDNALLVAQMEHLQRQVDAVRAQVARRGTAAAPAVYTFTSSLFTAQSHALSAGQAPALAPVGGSRPRRPPPTEALAHQPASAPTAPSPPPPLAVRIAAPAPDPVTPSTPLVRRPSPRPLNEGLGIVPAGTTTGAPAEPSAASDLSAALGKYLSVVKTISVNVNGAGANTNPGNRPYWTIPRAIDQRGSPEPNENVFNQQQKTLSTTTGRGKGPSPRTPQQQTRAQRPTLSVTTVAAPHTPGTPGTPADGTSSSASSSPSSLPSQPADPSTVKSPTFSYADVARKFVRPLSSSHAVAPTSTSNGK